MNSLMQKPSKKLSQSLRFMDLLCLDHEMLGPVGWGLPWFNFMKIERKLVVHHRLLRKQNIEVLWTSQFHHLLRKPFSMSIIGLFGIKLLHNTCLIFLTFFLIFKLKIVQLTWFEIKVNISVSNQACWVGLASLLSTFLCPHSHFGKHVVDALVT